MVECLTATGETKSRDRGREARAQREWETSDGARETQRAWCLDEVSWTAEVWYVIKLKWCILHLFFFFFEFRPELAILESAGFSWYGLRPDSVRIGSSLSRIGTSRLKKKNEKKKSGKTRPDAWAVASLAHCRIGRGCSSSGTASVLSRY